MNKITFLNQPKFSGHATDKVLDQGRELLIPQIENYLKTSDLFKAESVQVSFFQEGVSSLVGLIEASNKKYVLKISLRPKDLNREAMFLKEWESIGVNVPHIFEDGFMNGHPYILMQYIEAKTISTYYKENELDIKVFFQMGEVLNKMHTLKAVGYGKPVKKGEGEFKDFRTWIYEDEHNKRQIAYVKEHNLLPEDIYGSIEEALETLIKYSLGSESVYCHDDFAPYNIFHTNPLTVFDAVCMYNILYIDLGKSIVKMLSNDFQDKKNIDQFIEGYFSSKKELLDRKVLKAAVLLQSCKNFKYWHKKNRLDRIDMVRKYLETYEQL